MTIDIVPIWLDCDPGNDDAFAILLAAYDPKFAVVGISTVHGNAPVEMTTHNTLGLLDVLGLEQGQISVYRGELQPLQVAAKYALDVHGKLGLGGVVLPETPRIHELTDVDYLEAMRRAIVEHDGQLVVVATGTLTNVSKLISKYPEVKPKIRWLSVMGGGFAMGNVTPYAEFNFNADPHAARHVMAELGSKVVLTPLNYTHTAICDEATRRNMLLSGPRLGQMFYDIVMFYYATYQNKFGMTTGPPVHDPLALYSVLPMVEPNNNYGFKYLRRKIDVVVDGEREGETVLVHPDLDPSVEEDGGVYIGQSIDVGKFWDSVLAALVLAENKLGSLDKVTSK